MRGKAPEREADAADVTRPAEHVSRPVRLALGRDDEIAAGVHEVQNALTAVVGWLELARGSQDVALRERALRAIQTGVHRAKDLVARLADPAERFSVRSRAFRVAPILAETHELLHPRCASVGVALTVDVPDGDVVALGDPDRVEQIVSNLALNAIDAVLALPARDASRGQVHVGLTSDERSVSINVQDDGIGMDEATRARIFEPYFTTHPHAEGRRRAGTGLGLSVSRALAEAMGGKLSVASVPGKGTTVTLRLAREGAVLSAQPPSAGTELRPGTRVLVVDDEPAIRELLEVALTLRGADVVATATLDEARRQLESNMFDVVLVDETLGPQESGAVLVVELARSSPQLARVLMTGAPTLDHLPADACRWLLRKPFALDEVVRVLAGALEDDGARISRTE